MLAINAGIMITGGDGEMEDVKTSVEIFLPGKGINCDMPSMKMKRYFNKNILPESF